MKKLYHKIETINGSLITLYAYNIAFGELARIHLHDGAIAAGSVIAVVGTHVSVVVYGFVSVSSDATVEFLGHSARLSAQRELMLGRVFNGFGEPVDDRPALPTSEHVPIVPTAVNLEARAFHKRPLLLHHPMTDLPGPWHEGDTITMLSDDEHATLAMLTRTIHALKPDVIVLANVGIRANDLAQQEALLAEYRHKRIAFVHRADEPLSACLLVPDFALTAAEQFALNHQRVLVLFSDIATWCDAYKEHHLRRNHAPSRNGYPHQLPSLLQTRFDRAGALRGGGAITMVAIARHTKGDGGMMSSLLSSVSQHHVQLEHGVFKSQHVTPYIRHDQKNGAYLMRTLLTRYREAERVLDRLRGGLMPTAKEDQAIQFMQEFERTMMAASISLPIEDQLAVGFSLLQRFFPSAMDQTALEQPHLSPVSPKEIEHERSIHVV